MLVPMPSQAISLKNQALFPSGRVKPASIDDTRTIPVSVVTATAWMHRHDWGLLDLSCIRMLTPTARLVLAHIYPFALKSAYFFQSQGLIAQEIERSRKQVGRALRQLESYGLLRGRGRFDDETEIRTTCAYVLHPELLDKNTLLFMEKNHPELGVNFYHTAISPIDRLDGLIAKNVPTEYIRINRVKYKYNNLLPRISARVRVKNQGFVVGNEIFTPAVIRAMQELSLTSDQAVQLMQFPDAVIDRVVGEFVLTTDVKKPFEWCLQRSRNICKDKKIGLNTSLVEKIRLSLSLAPHPSSSQVQIQQQEQRNAALLSQQNAVFNENIAGLIKPQRRLTVEQYQNQQEVLRAQARKERELQQAEEVMQKNRKARENAVTPYESLLNAIDKNMPQSKAELDAHLKWFKYLLSPEQLSQVEEYWRHEYARSLGFPLH